MNLQTRYRRAGGAGAVRLGVWMALVTVLGVAPAHAQLIPSFGSDRAGTAGFQFLKIPVDGRAAALGQTVVANAADASALYWNPALAAQADGPQLGLHHTAYFADVALEYVGASVPLGRFGLTLGASLQALNSGEMDVTTEFEPFGTGETFRHVNVAAGLTVAQTLTDLFSYGVTARFVRESVADVATNTVVFDVGVFYRVGATGAQLGVAIRNFGPDGTPTGTLERITLDDGVVVEDDFESFTPPTTFALGLTYALLRENARNDLVVSGQLTNPNDNAETFNVGAEYVWNDLLALRTGYRFGIDEADLPSFGLGLSIPGLPADLGARLDYGFSRLERLGTVHRVGLNLNL